MAGHSSSQSPLFSTSSTLQKIPFELASSSRSRTPASFEIDSTVFLKTPSKVHLPSLPSRRVGRDSTWIEMMDMEEGRARESRTSEVEGDWRNLSAPRTNFEAPGHDSHYAQSSLTEPSPPSPTLVSKMALAWQYFIGILCTLYTIGICHLYFEKFRMRPERSSMSVRRSSVAGVDPTHAQWLTVTLGCAAADRWGGDDRLCEDVCDKHGDFRGGRDTIQCDVSILSETIIEWEE
ncbi:hypothetical protein D9613_012521 [Agrocybe pediades]|uniref:Uncharacterized protein n=1 Tax=Agrocybe pediades TaxID=84607 RepID=A0A8H4QRM5_9AGAR|nr:hypothetical protein D9613_012521 [Agrocybe pediades]